MSAQSFLVVGDQVMFMPIFNEGGMLIEPAITYVTSKSKNTATFRGITIEDDEKQWIVLICKYIKPPYVIPGFVMCKIKKLHNSNIAQNIKENDKSVLLVGNAQFDAEFTVLPGMGAKQPNNGSPDICPKYSGKGLFIQIVDSKAMNQG